MSRSAIGIAAWAAILNYKVRHYALNRDDAVRISLSQRNGDGYGQGGCGGEHHNRQRTLPRRHDGPGVAADSGEGAPVSCVRVSCLYSSDLRRKIPRPVCFEQGGSPALDQMITRIERGFDRVVSCCGL